MAVSVLEIFKVGIGPSSSHTVGPMRAARMFSLALAEQGVMTSVTRVLSEMFGSLGATGKGHGTDSAVLLGLSGHEPDTVDVDQVPAILEGIRGSSSQAGLIALSANFALYGDMSNRMMSVAAGLGPTQEIYSIDESFIGLDGVRGDLTKRSWAIRNRILQWTGIPCGVGIGPTKALAKLANHIAKTADRKPGSYPRSMATVCNLTTLPPSDLDAFLAATEAGEVWGVGRRIGKQLQEAGVNTVLDLARLSPALVRSRWGVVLERTVRELQGQPCIELVDAPPAKQQIACTRSFGRPITERSDLIEAISEFASRAAEKLRRQSGLAGQVLVFAHTSPFRSGPRFSKSIVVPLRRPTSDSRLIVQSAVAGVNQIYQPGYRLSKAGVMLLDLTHGVTEQAELDLEC